MVMSHSTFIITMCFLLSKHCREMRAPISGLPVASMTDSIGLERTASL